MAPPPPAPAYEAPTPPAYEAPAQPAYEAPAQPAYEAPAQPAFSQPSPAQPSFEEDPDEVAAADLAVNMLKKKVDLAPSTSLMDVDEVASPLHQDEELEDDYHASMDDCTKGVVVHWPEDRESLLD